MPALFNAEPTPPTCVSPGTFNTGFLGEPIEVDGDVAVYDFENVFVTVDRSVDGEVTLTIDAMPGFTLDDLDESKWDVNEDATSATRTIVLGEQLSGPEVCPLVVVPAPAAPTFADLCGTVNDDYTVPADTAMVRYEVVEDGATVTITAVLVSEADEFPAGAVTEWTFTFTDDACPAPAGGSTPPQSAPSAMLPATGGGDMMPWGIAAAVMLIARRNPGRCAPPRAALVRQLSAPPSIPQIEAGSPVRSSCMHGASAPGLPHRLGYELRARDVMPARTAAGAGRSIRA